MERLQGQLPQDIMSTGVISVVKMWDIIVFANKEAQGQMAVTIGARNNEETSQELFKKGTEWANMITS